MSEEKMTKEAMVEVIETLADKVLMLEYYVDDLKHSYKNLINNDDTVRVKVNGAILNVKRREILQEAHAHARDTKKHLEEINDSRGND